MKLEEIKVIAEKYLAMIKPYCLKAEIAGSIRRDKPECKDIEIVCVINPKFLSEFSGEVYKMGQAIKGTCYGKYVQRVLPEGIKLDLFIAKEDNYGVIKLIRTGNQYFSKWIMGKAVKISGYICKDGYIMKPDITKIKTPEEIDVFNLLGIKYIEPKEREWKED
jgi:DNA polymerase/3'-5' exonuclease PolX